MQKIILNLPKRLVFGSDSIEIFISDFISSGFKNLFVVTSPPVAKQIQPVVEKLLQNGINVTIDQSIDKEPTLEMFENVLQKARSSSADSVLGIGGGSAMDVAKLVSAFIKSDQNIHDAIGINKLKSRNTYLICIPTTSGTGSEVSPNALLIFKDPNNPDGELKQAVISPLLVPDAVYVDPKLTLSLPPYFTAITGMDALTHCIEVYVNKFANPLIDTLALEGVKLISQSLKIAYDDPNNLEAREKLALGSLFGGLGLGPVNTAAAHALAYPIGNIFKLPHGLTVAVMLPYVLKFNLEAAPSRCANIALALGAEKGKDDKETAMNGVYKIFELLENINLPTKLSKLNIPDDSIEKMAQDAIKIERLLKNNPREVTLEDAIKIYKEAL